MAEIEHYARLEPKQFLNDHLQSALFNNQLFKRQQPCLLLLQAVHTENGRTP